METKTTLELLESLVEQVITIELLGDNSVHGALKSVNEDYLIVEYEHKLKMVTFPLSEQMIVTYDKPEEPLRKYRRKKKTPVPLVKKEKKKKKKIVEEPTEVPVEAPVEDEAPIESEEVVEEKEEKKGKKEIKTKAQE